MAYYGLYSPSLFIRPFVSYDINVYRPKYFRALVNCPYMRTSRLPYDDGSPTTSTRKFEAKCDVNGFAIDEIKLSILNEDGRKVALVEAKKAAKENHSGVIPDFHISKRFILPNECDLEKIQSELSSDGVLKITAPYDARKIQRTIPILQTGEPSRRGAVRTINAKGG